MSDGFEIEHGILGGAVQSEFEAVPYGLASRSQAEQIDSMLQSKIKKRLESGYKTTIDEASAQDGRGLNALGMPRPMLAARYDRLRIDVTDYFHQPKLDGHRCIIHTGYDNGLRNVTAYSRNGKPIESISEILLDIKRNFPEEIYLDGELYIHEVPLQKITSLVKRRQHDTKLLQFWIYDIINPEDYENRFKTMEWLLKNCDSDKILLCPTSRGVYNAIETLQSYKRMGFEGAILRAPASLYEAGRRSKGLVKVKSFDDDEFQVIDIVSSKDGWAILVCLAKNGNRFQVSAPGPMETKLRTYREKDSYIGREVTVEYANLTNEGVPFHPVAIRWRDKINE